MQESIRGAHIPNNTATTPLIEQQLALHAYQSVAQVPEEKRKDHKIAVNDLAANILRNGLAAALAELERRPKKPTWRTDNIGNRLWTC